MGSYKVRHLVGKLQKSGHTLWYWQPPKALRKLGFLPRRLADPTNDRAQAIVEAERLNAELDAWRAGPTRTLVQPNTIPWLVRLYREDVRYTNLAAATKAGYNYSIKVIEAWSARAGHPPLASIQRKHVREFYRSMTDKPTTANHILRTLRLLLFFAVDEGVISHNPAAKQRLKSVVPRDQIWGPEQVTAFCAAAMDAGRASMALAVRLGVNLGQREGDILNMAWSQYDGSAVQLRQRKTGKLLSVPVVDELKLALDGAIRESPIMLISEATGRPYKGPFFQHEFARIRALANISGLLFMDLRRTAVVRLAEAGCSVPEISAITGHEIDRTAKILETYLPRTSDMARNAMLKLDEHRRKTKLEGRSA